MKDVTNDLTQFERGMLFYNCGKGVMVSDKGCSVFKRNYSSQTMKSKDRPNEIYRRTGEIMEDEFGDYCIVYRLHEPPEMPPPIKMP